MASLLPPQTKEITYLKMQYINEIIQDEFKKLNEAKMIIAKQHVLICRDEEIP